MSAGKSFGDEKIAFNEIEVKFHSRIEVKSAGFYLKDQSDCTRLGWKTILRASVSISTQ